jgi:hypothetical protein
MTTDGIGGNGHVTTKLRPSHPILPNLPTHAHSVILALPSLPCPTVDADAVIYQPLVADGGRVCVTIWKPGLEVWMVLRRCVLGYTRLGWTMPVHARATELK